ncbi:hypothetical protein [Hallella colorans]|uniref:hypothetical protein n=1 Tax=Hallella colorans TaxID=1703337 RepID=UPI00248DF3F9|nr:hypothetical protein [Hallella colorans]
MNNIIHKFLPLLVMAILASCDSGNIEETDPDSEQGRVVKIEGNIAGLKSWPLDYDVAVAGFSNKSNSSAAPYAEISKVVTTDANGNMSLVLSGISSDIDVIQICVLNRLRQRVMKFVSKDISNATGRDTIRLNVDKVDASMFNAIQVGIFNGVCSSCHNASRPAGGLDLTDGHSYASLVNHESVKVPRMKRVIPGDKQNSLLYQVLNSDISRSWKQDHTDMGNKERTEKYILQLINDWIATGDTQ